MTEQNLTTPAAQEPGTAQPPAEATPTDNEHMIPKSRLDEQTAKTNAALAESAQLRKEKQERIEKQLVKDNEFKALSEQRLEELDEIRPIAADAEAYKKSLEDSNAKRIESIPEESRSFVPDYDNPVKLGEWLDDNIKKLLKPVPGDFGAGSGPLGSGSGNNNGVELDAQEKEFAKMAGMTDEEYAKQKDK